jgi:ribonuclease HII
MAKEKKLLEDFGDYELVAGLDEVGRGCGAGPVVTAAVIMPVRFTHADLQSILFVSRNI